MLIGLPAPLLIHQHHQPSPKLMSKGHSDLPATAPPPNPPPKMQPPGERAHPARRTAASQRENCLNFQTVSPLLTLSHLPGTYARIEYACCDINATTAPASTRPSCPLSIPAQSSEIVTP